MRRIKDFIHRLKEENIKALILLNTLYRLLLFALIILYILIIDDMLEWL